MKSGTLRYGNLIAAMASIGACDIAFGLTLQLQPLIFESLHTPAWLIGTHASMAPAGIIVAGPFLPRVIKRFGGKAVCYAAIFTILACLLLFKLLPPFWWWFALRFAFGIAVGSLFAVSESWILTAADESNRGRVMGLYTAMLSLTFAVGPLILPFTGIEGWLPWLICMACVAISTIPLMFVSVTEDPHDQPSGSLMGVVRKRPLIFMCIAAATMFDGIIISFFTIFAVRNGVELQTASRILGVSIIGGCFLYYPLGMLADRWSRNGTITACTLATIIASLALIPLITHWTIWPVAMILFTTAFGVYVIALVLIGDVFKGNDVVAGAAAVGAMWGAGGIIGPPIAGRLIDAFGFNAMPITIAVIYIILAMALAWNGWRVVTAETA